MVLPRTIMNLISGWVGVSIVYMFQHFHNNPIVAPARAVPRWYEDSISAPVEKNINIPQITVSTYQNEANL